MGNKEKGKQNIIPKPDWDDRPIDTDAILRRMSENEVSTIYERIFGMPLEPKRKQIIKLRSFEQDPYWKIDPYWGLENLGDFTVIILCREHCDEKVMEYQTAEFLKRHCKDFAVCSGQNTEWKQIIDQIYIDLDGEAEDIPQCWTINSIEEIEKSLWICRDNVLIVCNNMEMLQCYRKSLESNSVFEDMESRMGMTWGAWGLEHDKLNSWPYEADWEGDPVSRLTEMDSDYLDMHEDEWIYYVQESKQKELDSKYRKKKVIRAYRDKHRNYLVCEKFPSAAARQYVHNGKEAFMASDGVGRPGYIILQDDAEEVDDDMCLGYMMPENFTLVRLNTERDLSGIKYLYLL